jgi:phosphatidylinositol glycan class B
MRTTATLGGDDPRTYLLVIRLAFVAMSLGTALGIYRLARAWRASEEAAAAGAAAWALAAPSIYFAHRAMSENAATFVAVWGVAFLLAPRGSRRSVWLGASLLGLSVLFRIQMGVVVLGVLGVLAARRNWRDLLESLAILGLWAVAYGGLDALTWRDAPGAAYGGWFHSARLYVQFNLIEGRSAQWGTSPPGYYLECIFRSMPIIAACLLIGVVIGLRHAPALSVLALLFLAAHAAIPHKEYRFILPMLPLALAATVASVDALPRTLRLAGSGLLLAGAVVSAVTFRALTWGDLGGRPDHPDAQISAWDASGSVNRLLLAAHTQRDLCGLRVDVPPAFHGASTYLHLPVPIYSNGPNNVDESAGFYNYAIARAGSGLRVVARDHDMELVRVAEGTHCRPDHRYDWRLP